MKNKIYIIMLLALSVMTGCNREISDYPAGNVPPQGEDILPARIECPSESGTKSYVSADLRVLWDESDAAAVFKYITLGQKYVYSGEAGTNDGSFTKSSSSSGSGSPLDYVYAVYPYSSGISMSGEGTIANVQIPRIQSYREQSFAKDANVSVSSSESSELYFKNLCGYLRLRLYGDDVTVAKITLEGNNGEVLSGKASVTVSPDSDPALTFSTSGSYTDIVLDCPSGVTLGTSAENATDFWFVIPPTSFSKGFRITVQEYDSNATFQKKASASFTVERNLLKNMAALEVVPKINYEVPEAVDLGLPSGLKWASFDLGATAESPRSGHRFKWGETGQRINSGSGFGDDYKWGIWDSANYQLKNLTKYCTVSEYGNNGFTDGKTKLEAEDDAATANLGSGWRTPTDAEWRELFAHTTGEYGATGFVLKSTVPGFTGKEIVFAWDDISYMSSTLNSSDPRCCFAAFVEYANSSMMSSFTSRNEAFWVHAVQGDEVYVPVTGINLNLTSIQLVMDGGTQLSASVTPSYATNANISWIASDPGIVTIQDLGDGVVLIEAVSVGETTVTAMADGGYTASCAVTVSYAQPEMIDLGLSVKWASMDIGARSSNSSGKLFAWGETSPKESYTWDNYLWCEGSMNAITKYATYLEGLDAFTDDKTTLELSDDAANVYYGDKWRMPTHLEWKELLDNCTVSSYSGGYRFTSKKAGYTNKSIIIPSGQHWTSSLFMVSRPAVMFGRESAMAGNSSSCSDYYRNNGYAIRPVYGNRSVPAAALRITGYSSTTIARSQTLNLGVNVIPEDATSIPSSFRWSSSNTSVATVTSAGKVSGVAPGTAVIRVETADGTLYDSITLEVTEIAVTSISFNQSTYSVKRGQTIKLTPTILPAEAAGLPVTWKSSNTSWATVDGGGNVTGVLKNKTVTITASAGTLSATCNVRIDAPDLVSFTLSPSPVTMFPFDQVKVTAVLNPSDAEVPSSLQYWNIDADMIAGIGGGGDYWRYINAHKAGTAVLRVVLNGNIERTVTINVQDPEPAAVDLGLSVKWGDRNFLSNGMTDTGRYYYFQDAVHYNGTDSDVAEYYTDGEWRLPTKAEVEELLNTGNCTSAKATEGGVTGLRFTSKSTGKSIFLPDVGGYSDGTYYTPSQMGCFYWTSTTSGTDVYRLMWTPNVDGTYYYSPMISPAPSETYLGNFQFVLRPVKAN